ncbi:MAG: ABC transporter ATP-binding protein/permease [Ruminococcus sp.]|nr:ABC transporter ATP-binding protein/permease [Ruminococcus sp.]
MLEIKRIKKIYETEDLKQVALDEVSINFRENEFAAILGPSGSGKTTLLNIIGGLDTYNSGDLVINGISTKKYTDRDWDTYRNHRVGFVFQSYNLISHQSILQNVELALTLSGVSKKERKKRAIKALEDVGLGKHINKRPNQLSGGQMQRVAIARALVNDPSIILADEPTGALDSETSKQIMELITEISHNKLVIMVTHNPELAEEYANRIIRLKDGHITHDSNPYGDVINGLDIEANKEIMDIISNIREDETVIMATHNGDLAKGYASRVIKLKDGYITHDSKLYDDKESNNKRKEENNKNKKTSMNLKTALSLSLNNLMTKKGRTILTAFAGSIGIIGIALILSLSNGVQEYIDKTEKETLSGYPLVIEANTMDFTSMMNGANQEKEVTCKDNNICTTDDITNSPSVAMANNTITNNLEKFKSELDNNYKNINDYVMDIKYTYGLDLQIYSSNTDKIVQINPNTLDLTGGEQINEYENMYSMMYSSSIFEELIDNEDLLNGQYDVLAGRMPSKHNEMVLVVDEKSQIPASVMYALDIENRDELTDIIKKAKDGVDVRLLSINYDYNDLVGKTFKLVLNTDYYQKQNGIWLDKSTDTDYMKQIIDNGLDIEIVGVIKVNEDAVSASSGYVGYTHDLTEYVINEINRTDIAKEQLADENIDIFTGRVFDGFLTTYEKNLEKLGIYNLDNPKGINIYPKDYEAKDNIIKIIDEYNKEHNDEDKINYTDYVGVLMNGITTIVNVITYVLIAFVAISLVVSSIMIAIITYISVLERTKEIGILRAIGASKKDVTRVFNAETIIEGLVAGILGIGITLLLNIPINIIVKDLLGVKDIASLPLYGAIGLILISVILTVIAGLIPSRVAAKKDPVEALRSE